MRMRAAATPFLPLSLLLAALNVNNDMARGFPSVTPRLATVASFAAKLPLRGLPGNSKNLWVFL